MKAGSSLRVLAVATAVDEFAPNESNGISSARRFACTNDMLEQTAAAKFAHGAAARCFGEDHLRSGLFEYRGQLDCGEQRVDQNGNDAELHRSEKRGSELRRVTHLEENEIAAF